MFVSLLKNSLRVLLACAVFLCLFLPLAEAQISLGVLPPKVTMELMPGDRQEFSLELINNNDHPLVFRPMLRGTKGADEYGNPIIVALDPNDKWQVGNWVLDPVASVEVAPFGTQEVRFTVQVPEDTPAGGYYGLVIFSPDTALSQEGSVSVVSEIGIPILAKVGSGLKEQGKVVHFDLDIDALRDGDPIRFRLRIQNEGNVHLLPQGRIMISVDGVPLEAIGRTMDTEGKETMVDYLDVNPGNGYVLPNSTRTFIIPWKYGAQYGRITATYEVRLNGDASAMERQEATFELSKDVAIQEFLYDQEARGFRIRIENRGNVQVPLQGQVALYRSQEATPYETVFYPQEGSEVRFLAAGATESIFIPWVRRGESTDPTLEEYGLFMYVLDSVQGTTLTQKVQLPKSGKAANVHPMHVQLPYMIVIVILIGLIGVLLVRNARKD